MILAFTLNMPGCPSWNGRWSGEGKKYVIVKTFLGHKNIVNGMKVLEGRSFSYRWDDGWCARIDVHQVDSRQAAKLRKESSGFCGYDWMVNTIIKYGKAMADHEVKEFLASKTEPSVS